ncbi:MAG TPA: VCBS repeat-containing protein [Pirellulales bacterium]|jgi:hypothetical protein|nr:VCBS repeat-containing protein [Pirellulales bacterium]
MSACVSFARSSKLLVVCLSGLSLGASASSADRTEVFRAQASRAITLKQISYLPPLDEPLVPAVVPKPMRTLAQQQLFAAQQPLPASWHLSVLNGGQPRSAHDVSRLPGRVIDSARSVWPRESLVQATWKFRSLDDSNATELPTTFGLARGTPLCADFNGDGQVELGLFAAGRWWIDINGNRAWDEDDLSIRLGDADDQPVLGDWDGDGKADIGVFGRSWSGDREAVMLGAGLPDADNGLSGRPKNVPLSRAAFGSRDLQLTAFGQVRTDVIDHVLQFGASGDRAISGDFNGDGIDTVGIFRHGHWVLDTDGDGRYTDRDLAFDFGPASGTPIVGDFNGDGRDEVGVYDQGVWHLDTNGDRMLDNSDQVIHWGTAGELPFVADFNGEGRDSLGLYAPTTVAAQ